MLRQNLNSAVRAARRINARQFSQRTSRVSTTVSNSYKSGLGLRFIAGAAGITAATIGYYTFNGSPVISLDRESAIQTPNDVEYIQPETKSNPFPATFTSHGEQYDLLGVGVRTVSFLSIHVYAIGIYIANADKGKVKQLLGSQVSEEDLLDPTKSGDLVAKLLNGGVRFDLRIVPVRNTDFGHLRDGLVRTIMAHPRFKAEGNNEDFGEGLAELKRMFGRKIALPKNKILHMTRDQNGVLEAEFYQSEKEDNAAAMELGKVTKPLVTELLLLQYLSGAKPSSESARREAIKTLSSLTF